jgi:guanine nucleotide-binding protein G(i) subunit alpha
MGNFESVRDDSTGKPTGPLRTNSTISASGGACNCLLLGTGFSGKSTLFFQLVKLDENQKKVYKEIMLGMIPTIYFNTFLLTMYTADEVTKNSTFTSNNTLKLVEKVKKALRLDQDPRGFYEYLLSEHCKGSSIDIVKTLIEIWKDGSMLSTLPSLRDCQYYFDGAEHFCSAETLERLSVREYQPTEEDVLRSRRKTTGVFTTSMSIDGLTYSFTDVGGQRNERKKWIQVCKNADIVVYVISLSDYDEVLWEDQSINRMMEALETFENSVNQDYFKDVPIVVAFNKIDLLKKKLSVKDSIKDTFGNYGGGKDYEKAIEFLKAQFLDRYKGNPDNIASVPLQLLNGGDVRKGFELVQAFGLRLQKEGKLKGEPKK